jgi:hypothetical protein
MGRTYVFECTKCGCKAKVSGRPERGVRFAVNTVSCKQCKQLYDVITRLKLPQPGDREIDDEPPAEELKPPAFESVVNRLSLVKAKKYRWVAFELHCPRSPGHQVHAWKDPGKCPRCGIFMERSALPFCLWE